MTPGGAGERPWEVDDRPDEPASGFNLEVDRSSDQHQADRQVCRRAALAAGLTLVGTAGCLRLQEPGQGTGSPGGSPGGETPNGSTRSPTDRPAGGGTDTPAGETDAETATETDTETATATPRTLSVTTAWPQFQRDGANTGDGRDYGAIPEDPTLYWASETTVGYCNMAPVVGGGRVFVPSHYESQNATIDAFDANTGAHEWTRDIEGWAEFTPAYGDGRLYVPTGSGRLNAIDAASGQLEWFVSASASGDPQTVTPPTYHEGSVYVGTVDGYVSAFDATNGAMRWSVSVDGLVTAPPTVAGDRVYVTRSVPDQSLSDDLRASMYYYGPEETAEIQAVGGHGVLSALRASDGGEVASTDLPEFVTESATVVGGDVYVGAWDGVVRAYDAGTLAGQWNSDDLGGVVSTTPTADDERVYVGSTVGTITALSRTSGDAVWQVGVREFQRAQPALVGDLLYIPTRASGMVALLPSSGAGRWSWAGNNLPDGAVHDVHATPVDGALFVVSEQRDTPIYALGPP